MAHSAVPPLSDDQPALTMLMSSAIRRALGNLPTASNDHEPPAAAVDIPGLAASFENLNRAAKGIAALGAGFDQLKNFAAEREVWFETEIQRMQGQAIGWEQKAKSVQARLWEQERQFDDMRQRAEDSEERERRIRASLETLQDRITTILGAESEAGRILHETPLQYAAE